MPISFVRRGLHAVSDWLVKRLLHADDPPHRLALGAAIGMFVTFLPLIGFQMALVVVLATLLRANKAVGLPIVWITNPATIVPVFYACYVIGRLMLGHRADRVALVDGVGIASARLVGVDLLLLLQAHASRPGRSGPAVSSWRRFTAVLTYAVTYWTVAGYRERLSGRDR